MDLSSEDLKIFGEIEKIREDIKRENIKIEYLDFGAGSPTANKTQSQMYEGDKTSKSTKDLCAIGLKQNWAQLLYKLVKENKPKRVLELGTCCGFSSIYMSKASPSSQIYTIEGAKEVAQIAKRNIEIAKCKNINQKIGRFQDVLKPILNELESVNFVFIDGHHDKIATLNYYEIIKPYLTQNAIVIFDDISWSEKMREAWDEIIKDSDIKRYEDLEKLGICYF